jgi:hypothetical protein
VLPLIMIVSVFTLNVIMNCSNMPWMKPSLEAPGHLGVPLGFLLSLPEIIVGL